MRFARLYTRWRLRLGSPVRPTTAKMPHIVLLDVTFLCRTTGYFVARASETRRIDVRLRKGATNQHGTRERCGGQPPTGRGEAPRIERARSDGLGGSETAADNGTRRRADAAFCGRAARSRTPRRAVRLSRDCRRRGAINRHDSAGERGLAGIRSPSGEGRRRGKTRTR